MMMLCTVGATPLCVGDSVLNRIGKGEPLPKVISTFNYKDLPLIPWLGEMPKASIAKPAGAVS